MPTTFKTKAFKTSTAGGTAGGIGIAGGMAGKPPRTKPAGLASTKKPFTEFKDFQSPATTNFETTNTSGDYLTRRLDYLKAKRDYEKAAPAKGVRKSTPLSKVVTQPTPKVVLKAPPKSSNGNKYVTTKTMYERSPELNTITKNLPGAKKAAAAKKAATTSKAKKGK